MAGPSAIMCFLVQFLDEVNYACYPSNVPRKKPCSKSTSKTSGIKSWPLSERPREILLEKGSQALSDAGLISILLRGGTKGKSAISLARSLIQKFGSLRQLLQARPEELYSVSGIGPAKAAQIIAACEIGIRKLKENAVESFRVRPLLLTKGRLCGKLQGQTSSID